MALRNVQQRNTDWASSRARVLCPPGRRLTLRMRKLYTPRVLAGRGGLVRGSPSKGGAARGS